MDVSDQFLPFDADAQSPPQSGFGARTLSDRPFAYVGRALSAAEFAAYVASYAFGSIPPDFVVLHHTAGPSATWARYPSGAVWDADEGGLSDAQIRAKRVKQLDAIMRYYRDSKGWAAGPHLFIDDRWIYLFTPMNTVGIHAAQGNGWRDRTGLHYSIGIEVVGYYEHTPWPAPVAANVRSAVRALLSRLPTIKAEYVRGPGGICSHRDWNKPSCPGRAITAPYYLDVIRGAGEPHAGLYRVKASVTAGASVRSGPATKKPVLDHLRAGQQWEGGEVQGQRVTLAPFGTSDVWICNAQGHCVWSLLLEQDG